MAVIQVDYEDIARNVASKVQTSGLAMYKDIEKARNALQNMGNCWTGERYNLLVKEFNTMIAKLNKILKIVCDSLPSALVQIGSNYAIADEETFQSAKGGNNSCTINVLSAKGKVFRFKTAEVTQQQQIISNAFADCITHASNIEQACYNVVWEGKAAKTFYSKIGTIKSSLTNSFEEVKQRLNDYIGEASAQVEVAESKNTVGGRSY